MGVNWESHEDACPRCGLVVCDGLCMGLPATAGLLVESGTERVAREVYERAVIRAIFGSPMVGFWDAFKQGQWARATGRPRSSNPFDIPTLGTHVNTFEWYRGWDYGISLETSALLSTTRLQGADAPPAGPDLGITEDGATWCENPRCWWFHTAHKGSCTEQTAGARLIRELASGDLGRRWS